MAKTRSQASELVSKGKIKLNDVHVKPSREVKVNDVISLQKNNACFRYQVVNLLDKRVGAKLVENYVHDKTEPEELEKHKQYQLAQSAYRNNGTGKPTKKDRRNLDDFLDW